MDPSLTTRLRRALDALRGGRPRASLRRRSGYVGGKRTNANWDWQPALRSGDSEIQMDHTLLTARARWLSRNDPLCSKARRTLTNYVVGCGITTKAHARRDEGGPYQEFNRAADRLYREWAADQADAVEARSATQMFRTAFMETVEAGEILLIERQLADADRLVPIAFELAEAEQIDDTLDVPAGQGQNEIRRGVERDGRNRVVAYWIYTRHPNDFLSPLRSESERVPAWKVIHLYRRERSSQTRGVTWFAPIVNWIHNLGGYVGSEIAAAKTASAFVALFKNDAGRTSFGLEGEEDTEDEDGRPLAQLPNSPVMLYGGPQDELSVIQSNRPNSAAGPFLQLMLQMMGVGMGVGYSKFSGDFTRKTYSSHRAEDLNDQSELSPVQDWFSGIVALEIRRRVVRQLIGMGHLKVPGGPATFNRNPKRWLAAVARPPGYGWLDPQKQVKAAREAIGAGLSTWEIELAKLGLDWQEVFDQLAAERTYARELGLPFETLFGPPPGSPSAGGANGGGGDDESDLDERIVEIVEQRLAEQEA